jgi:hypothetical protein
MLTVTHGCPSSCRNPIGVDRNADKRAIKSAYRQQARRWHPVSEGEGEGEGVVHALEKAKMCFRSVVHSLMPQQPMHAGPGMSLPAA